MSTNSDIAVIVLAAGKGKRMLSDEPKVIRKLLGKPAIAWGLETLKSAGLGQIYIVVGHKAELVQATIVEAGHNDVHFILEPELLGTARSAATGLAKLPKTIKTVFIVFGDDSALYSKNTFKKILDYFFASKAPGVLLTSARKVPSAVGGLLKDDQNRVVEVATLSKLVELNLPEHDVLCGVMCFDRQWLENNLPLIKINERSGEYPLPALIGIASLKGEHLHTFRLDDPTEWESFNTPDEANQVELILKKRQDEQRS